MKRIPRFKAGDVVIFKHYKGWYTEFKMNTILKINSVDPYGWYRISNNYDVNSFFFDQCFENITLRYKLERILK